MNEGILNVAIRAASSAAKTAGEYKSETYSAVLLFELMRLANDPRHAYEITTIPPDRPGQRQKALSPAELFATKPWSTETDKVVIAGYFLEHFGGSAGYTLDELKNCLVAAKIPVPKNISLAILQAIQKGLLMEVPSQGNSLRVCVLTQSGEQYVENLAKTK